MSPMNRQTMENWGGGGGGEWACGTYVLRCPDAGGQYRRVDGFRMLTGTDTRLMAAGWEDPIPDRHVGRGILLFTSPWRDKEREGGLNSVMLHTLNASAMVAHALGCPPRIRPIHLLPPFLAQLGVSFLGLRRRMIV